MSAWLAEPGGLQVQAALQLLAGGLADGAVVVQAAQFGVLGGIEVTAQFPVGQAIRPRRPVPLEYSIEQLTCAVASRLDAGMVG